MSWPEFIALLSFCTAMSFSPGPNTAISAALGAQSGVRGALPFVCAVPLGWGLMLLVCSHGVGGLLLQWPALVWGIKGAGVAYLLWLAQRLATSGQWASAQRLNAGFGQGLALQWVNIKAWMLALTLTAGWLAGQADFGWRLAQVGGVLLAFAFFSNLAYAALGAGLRQWLAQGQRLLAFNRAMAAVLVLTAFWMLWA